MHQKILLSYFFQFSVSFNKIFPRTVAIEESKRAQAAWASMRSPLEMAFFYDAASMRKRDVQSSLSDIRFRLRRTTRLHIIDLYVNFTPSALAAINLTPTVVAACQSHPFCAGYMSTSPLLHWLYVPHPAAQCIEPNLLWLSSTCPSVEVGTLLGL